MPGTTLGIIPLQAFETGGTLYGGGGLLVQLGPDCVWSLCIVWLWVRQAGSNRLSSLQASSSHCWGWWFVGVLTAVPACPLLPAPAAPADTPGVHLHHRVPHMLAPDELRLLHPRRRLAPFTPPSPAAILQEQEGEDGEGEEQGSAAAGSSWKDRVSHQ